jgi:ribonucleoside-diphosphate reductase alpha chain
MSAELAREHGAFAGYGADKENMLRVIRNHRRAAHGISRASDEYESLRIRPVPIDHSLIKANRVRISNANALLGRAVKAWDEALTLGEKYGYRNAQTTVIAPTGTIGLLMDCDTTGVEPDFALVKFKKLAGGGYFKIANESVRPSLKALGYSETQIGEIMAYILGALSLRVPCPASLKGEPGETLASFLIRKGLPVTEIAKIEESLPGVFDISFAFSAWAISPEALTSCGIDPAAASADPSFNLLKHLGISAADIETLNLTICGTSTIEGAPHLKADHLSVFDCANKCGKLGKRFIAPGGHIRMMAAAQPFISGAISKTINLPNEASIDDIKACYRESWELGLKANALYRDGCKLSQPLSATADEAKKEAGKEEAPKEVAAAAPNVVSLPAATMDLPVNPAPARAARRRLADTRRSLTHKFNVAGHEGYLTVGLYDDGQPGELFITMSKEGSTIGGLMDSLGTATSVSLQYGVPVKSLVDKFSHQRFEPAGMTENPDIPIAKSLVDYIFRWMGMQFIPGYREAHAPKRGGDHHHEEPTPLWQGNPRITPAVESPRIAATTHTVVSHEVKVSTTSTGGLTTETETVSAMSSTLSEYMNSVGDAPACDVCGTITVRSGTCYKCVNCGNSMGCS